MRTYVLKSLNVNKLSNIEIGQFVTRLFEDLAKVTIDLETDPSLKKLVDDLKTQNAVYDTALKQVYAAEESKTIAKLGKVRENDFQILKDSIRLHRYAKVETEKKSYEDLKLLLDSNKKEKKETYEEFTKRVRLLIESLKSSKYADDVKTLGIKKYVDELEKSNDEFNELFGSRSIVNLQKGKLNTRKERKDLNAKYQKLVNYVVAINEVTPSDNLKTIIGVVNNIRKYYADIVARKADMPRGKAKKISDNTNKNND